MIEAEAGDELISNTLPCRRAGGCVTNQNFSRMSRSAGHEGLLEAEAVRMAPAERKQSARSGVLRKQMRY